MMRISILTLIKRILRGIKNVMLIFLCYVGVSILLCLVRCNRDEYNYFDRMMLAGWNTSDTIVDLSRLTPFQWDTMYYYENGCSEEVMASFGVIADADMQDVIIFKDKEGRTVYWDKWVYSWDYAHDRTPFSRQLFAGQQRRCPFYCSFKNETYYYVGASSTRKGATELELFFR